MICVDCLNHAKGLELGAAGRVPLCTACFILRLIGLPQGATAVKRIVLDVTGAGLVRDANGNLAGGMSCLRCGRATAGVMLGPGSETKELPTAGRVRVPLCAECGVRIERVVAFHAEGESGLETVQGIKALLTALERMEPDRW